MPIKIKMPNDIKVFSKFNLFHNFRMKSYSMVGGALMVIAAGTYCSYMGEATLAIVLYVFAAIFPFLMILLNNIMAINKVKGNYEFEHTVHTYVFNEDKMDISVKFGKKEGKYFFSYDKIFMIFERADIYYIYVSPREAFIATKGDIISGTEQELTEFLKSKVGCKFKAYKKKAKKV